MIDVQLISRGPVTESEASESVSPALPFKVVFVDPFRINAAAPLILFPKVIQMNAGTQAYVKRLKQNHPELEPYFTPM